MQIFKAKGDRDKGLNVSIEKTVVIECEKPIRSINLQLNSDLSAFAF